MRRNTGRASQMASPNTFIAFLFKSIGISMLESDNDGANGLESRLGFYRFGSRLARCIGFSRVRP